MPSSFPDLPASSDQPVLTVDLGAVQNNWRLMQGNAHGARTSGVIKSNGYGCGVVEIGQALVGAGCDLLFVATPDEGLELRSHSAFEGVTIAVLNGAPSNREKDFRNNALVPVVNDLNHYKSWMALQESEGQPLPFVIHIDTGMNRLGMSAGDAAAIAAEPERVVIAGFDDSGSKTDVLFRIIEPGPDDISVIGDVTWVARAPFLHRTI